MEDTDLIKRLTEFYSSKGLNRENFKCEYFKDCTAIANKANQEIKFKGSQAHVGSLYGQNLKVLVLSLDAKGHDNLDERRRRVQSSVYGKDTIHMKGTIEFLQDIFPKIEDEERLKSFSMTNAAKCSEGSNKLPSGVYKKCSGIHKKEISILAPDLIFAQGVDALPSFAPKPILDYEMNTFLESLSDKDEVKKAIAPTIRRYCKYIDINGTDTLTIHAPHPSARGGQWQLFRKISLPIIILFIDFKFKK